MCNMAAYSGTRPAAPILLNMLEAQEGLWGGHYSGIATVYEGNIFCAKVCGNVKKLRSMTNAETLPGCIGIAHSRTPGIDSDLWAHPFVSYDKNVVYCANGDGGIFKNTSYDRFYEHMKKAGMAFSSEVPYPCPPYPLFSDGHSVHISEIMSNVTAELLKKKANLRSALQDAFQTLPAEVAALALSIMEPDTISGIRINQPLMLGKGENESFLSTSALGFNANKTHSVCEIPPATLLTLSKSNIITQNIHGFRQYLADMQVNTTPCEILDKLFAGGSFCVAEMVTEINQHFPADKMTTAAMAVYEYLRKNLQSGIIEMERRTEPSSRTGWTAPRWYFHTKQP